MKIQKVEKINFARFRNFNWDAKLDLFCDEVNILFGWNGSGKTTLSKFFRFLENNYIDNNCTFKISTDLGQLTEMTDFTSFGNTIRVFNDDYIKEILSGSSKIPYIFFAGENSVDYAEDEKKLDEKRLELSKLILPSKHDEIARNTALIIKGVTGINSYRKELTGGSTYASYDKTDFEKRIKEIDERIKKGELKSYSNLIKKDIDSLKDQLVNNDRIAKIDKDISTVSQWLINNINSINNTLDKEPIQEQSKRIIALEQEQIAWVRKGVSLHFGDKKINNCLFCESEIKNVDELLKHFSNEVVNSIDVIDEYLHQINEYTTNFAKIESPTATQKENIDFLRSILDKLTFTLREKRNNVSQKKNVFGFDSEKVKSLIPVKSLDTTTIAYAIESHYVANGHEEYRAARADYEQAVALKESLENDVSELDKQVRILKQKARSTHEPASALNYLFKTVFLYRAIEITDNDDGTGYILKRDGENCAFSSLSEGEKNFIALAYFIYSINDAQNQLPDSGIVIIDDPVSSLDKQAIFQIYSVLVNEIKKQNSRQYFLLTHNLDFLGHLKECFRKKIDRNEVRLFNLTATNNGCLIEPMPTLLRNHRSDYYYVFSVLHKYKDNCPLEETHLVVNLLRRWLETFLEFEFSTSGDLQSTLEIAYKEAQSRTALWKTPFNANHLEIYRFINHGSHGFPDTESIDDSILINASQRIQEAFQLVNILDPLHYKKLESLTN